MKQVRFNYNKKEYIGILEDNKVLVNIDRKKKEFFLEDIELLSPCIPSKVVCVGLNYLDHIKELNMKVPGNPIIFIKPSTSVIGYKQNIIYPKCSKRLDYEAELAVVVKNKIKSVSRKEAKKHILGYTCFNDVTCRDIQKKEGQWSRAKSFDTFSVIGPCIETDFLKLKDIKICSYLNGQLKQNSKTSNMIFDVFYLIEFISSIMTLLPQDVIATGTPVNVGQMKVGDEIVVEIEGIGRLVNNVIAEV